MAVFANLTLSAPGFFLFFSLALLVLIVDSHAHLGMPAFDQDRQDVIQTAFAEGIEGILCPAEISDENSIRTTGELAEKYTRVFVSGGIHPHHAKEFTDESIKTIETLAAEKKILAVGEIGLDYHYNFCPPDIQRDVFRAQLNIADQIRLPVIIHSREAAGDIFDIIKEENYKRGGIVHCFTENWSFAEKMLDLGFMISFSGIITFPKAHELRETARKIPMHSLLIETDSPYLVPYPARRKIERNEPKYVKETALCLSQLKMRPIEDFSAQTDSNFASLAGIEI